MNSQRLRLLILCEDQLHQVHRPADATLAEHQPHQPLARVIGRQHGPAAVDAELGTPSEAAPADPRALDASLRPRSHFIVAGS